MALQQTNGTADILALLGAVKGSKQTTSTQSNMSSAGVQELVNQALRGNQGLAAVSGMQKGAGMYSSTVNTQMTNDLLSQITAKTEAMRAGTTTTQKVAPQVSGKEILGLMALMKAKGFTKQKWDSWKLGDVNTSGQSVSSWQDAGSGLGSSLAINDGTVANSVNPFLSSFLGSDASSFSPESLSAVTDLLSGATGATDAASTASNFATSGLQFESGASITGATPITGGVSTAGNAGSGIATKGTDILGGSGSDIGYLGSALDAYGASRTNKDYRRAVGSGILNYFGWGAATPVVDAVARPLTDKVMDNGYDVNGIQGAYMNDPASTVLSGRYNEKDLLTSVLDPANLFGGNEGGSVEGFLKQTLDPLGSLFGW